MSVRYALFAPDGPGQEDGTQRYVLLALLSVRFPRAFAQGQKLATHYGPSSFIAHDVDGKPHGTHHPCYRAPRTTVEVNRTQLQQAVKAGRGSHA